MISEEKKLPGVIKRKVIKSNSLVSARYTQKYSLHEQKTILYLLALIDEKTIEKNEYEVSIKQYAKFLDVDPSYIYQEAENIAKKLASKAIKIEDENGDWIVCSWLSGMRYTDGKLYLSVYDGLKPHLLNLKSNFTTYQLQNVMRLSSSYAIRVYEILAQFIKIGSRTVKLSVLREMLGVGENELKQFVHFKTKVLVISQREINSKTDIEFDWEPIKDSRKIVGIKFNIRKKHHEVLDSGIDSFIKIELEKIGFNLSEISKLCKDYNQVLIKEKINYLLHNLKKERDIKVPKRWLIAAVVNDYNTEDMQKNDALIFNELSPEDKMIKTLKEKLSQVTVEMSSTQNQINGWLAKYDEKYKLSYEENLISLIKESEEIKKQLAMLVG